MVNYDTNGDKVMYRDGHLPMLKVDMDPNIPTSSGTSLLTISNIDVTGSSLGNLPSSGNLASIFAPSILIDVDAPLPENPVSLDPSSLIRSLFVEQS
ncbi:hypothetical protein GH714_000967 [Hevea brasiliensis]|uniref:Uncharacterized protein n=1 Tax=Hevea brasiliensis TaxID=3981 RepID=A0A6A6LHZ4_HEVBR|nr:hypothetical protein GH714_000967 [Hevea brasiliensis]